MTVSGFSSSSFLSVAASAAALSSGVVSGVSLHSETVACDAFSVPCDVAEVRNDLFAGRLLSGSNPILLARENELFDMAGDVIVREGNAGDETGGPVELSLSMPLPFASAAARNSSPIDKFEMAARKEQTSRGKTSMSGDVPKLSRSDTGGLRSVIESHPSFNPDVPWSMSDFLRLQFEHRLFKGTGRELMRHLDLPIDRPTYVMFMSQVLNAEFVKRGRTYYFSQRVGPNALDYADVAIEAAMAFAGSYRDSSVDLGQRFRGWRALGGQFEAPSPEEETERAELKRDFAELFGNFEPVVAQIVAARLGFFDDVQSWRQIGEACRMTSDQACHLDSVAMRYFRDHMTLDDGTRHKVKPVQAPVKREKTVPRAAKPVRIPADTEMRLPKLLHPYTFETVGYVDPGTGTHYLFNDYDPERRSG